MLYASQTVLRSLTVNISFECLSMTARGLDEQWVSDTASLQVCKSASNGSLPLRGQLVARQAIRASIKHVGMHT